MFYSTSIADGVIQVAGLFLLRETYAPRLLQMRAKKLRKETGDNSYETEVDRLNRSLAQIIGSSLIRPFRLIATQSIVQVLALYMVSEPKLVTSPYQYNT